MEFKDTVYTLRSGDCKKCGEYFNWRNGHALKDESLNKDRICKECWENKGNTTTT